jgi:hypothetical protein
MLSSMSRDDPAAGRHQDERPLSRVVVTISVDMTSSIVLPKVHHRPTRAWTDPPVTHRAPGRSVPVHADPAVALR